MLCLINWQWSDLTLLPPSSQYKTLHPTTPHDTLPPPHQNITQPTIPNTQSHQHISQYRNTLPLPLVLGQDLKGCQLTTCRSILFIDVTALAIVDISYHQNTTYPLRLGLTLTKHKPNHLTVRLPNCPLQQHHRVWAAITEQRKMEANTIKQKSRECLVANIILIAISHSYELVQIALNNDIRCAYNDLPQIQTYTNTDSWWCMPQQPPLCALVRWAGFTEEHDIRCGATQPFQKTIKLLDIGYKNKITR